MLFRSMEVKPFGVIGSGQMGNGIAQVAAVSGLNVIMSDIKQEFCDKGVAAITKNLGRLVSKDKLSEADKNAILGRIKTTTDLKDMAAADFVVEAAETLESLTEVASLKEEELDVIGELISNMYGALEVNKKIQEGVAPKQALNDFMKRVLGSIDK